MGVPELLKFAAKAPGALSRIRHQGAVHIFDYILVDGTNVIQTVGVDAVVSLLSSKSIVVNEGIFVLLDSQRDRAGTSREQRSHLSSHSLDVNAQKLCTSLVSSLHGAKIFYSGREVEGEADLKLLHLHRALTVAANAQGKLSPKFLFISEDSDVLAGALCGPSPNSCFIATRLRDATHELCILSVEAVVAWMTGVTRAEVCREDEAAPQQIDDTPEEEVVESRHKKDGPMVGKGIATYFAESDDETDNVNPIQSIAKSEPAPVVTFKVPSYDQKQRARRRADSCIDLILLFLLLKGSGYVAPIIKGATKVDMSSIWASYMHLGRSVVRFEGNTMSFDGPGLAKVLQSAHLFDNLTRPANEDEVQSARKYLFAVAKSLARSIIGFRGPHGSLDLVDSRSDQIVETPSLAALYALLDRPQLTSVATSLLFVPSQKPVASPIEESLMLLTSARPAQAPRALPSVKVAIVQLLSTSSISSLSDLFAEISLRELLSSPGTEASVVGSSFSFDLRRMVASDAPAKSQTNSAVLAAAGLSTGYSYKIDIAKVLARAHPNKKPEAPVEEPVVAAPIAVVPPTQNAAPVRRPRVHDATRGAPRPRTHTAAPGAVATAPKDARKGKKRMGKKERALMAKKIGNTPNK